MGEKIAQKGTQEARFTIQLSYQTCNTIKHVQGWSFPQNMSFTSLMDPMCSAGSGSRGKL